MEQKMTKYQVIARQTRTSEARFTIEADTKNKKQLKLIVGERLGDAVWDNHDSYTEMILFEIVDGNEPAFLEWSYR
jgi:hypothetical protein